MKKKLAAVFLVAMLSVEPCSMVYAEDFAEGVSAESDIDLTEGVEAEAESGVEAEPEPEAEETQEPDIADNGDSADIADALSLEDEDDDDYVDDYDEIYEEEDVDEDIDEDISEKDEKKVSKLEIVKLPAKTTFTFPLAEDYDEKEYGIVDLSRLTIK